MKFTDNQKAIVQAIMDGKSVLRGDGIRRQGYGAMHLFLADQALNQPMEWTVEPQTIRIGDRDVPEPLRVVPELGARYSLANIIDGTAATYCWHGNSLDFKWLKNGLIHATEEAAQAHIDEILELSRVGKD